MNLILNEDHAVINKAKLNLSNPSFKKHAGYYKN